MTVPTAIQSEDLFSGLDPIADIRPRDRGQDASGGRGTSDWSDLDSAPPVCADFPGESGEHPCALI